MLIRACWPVRTRAISSGRMRASTSNVSRMGEISAIGAPGETAAPTVVTSTRLIRPAKGARTVVRSTRASSAGMVEERAASSACALASSSAARARQSCRAWARLARASATPAVARASAACACAASLAATLAALSAWVSASRGSIPFWTSGRIVSNSVARASRALWRAASADWASATARVACTLRAP